MTAPVAEAKETANDDNGFSCSAASTAARRSPLRPGGGWYLRRLRRALVTYPQVFPIGTTRSLQIDYVAGRNFPLETPRVEVKFSQALGDMQLPQDALEISPAVTRLDIRKDGAFLVAEGDFKPDSRYSVTVSEKILGNTGYGLAQTGNLGCQLSAQGECDPLPRAANPPTIGAWAEVRLLPGEYQRAGMEAGGRSAGQIAGSSLARTRI